MTQPHPDAKRPRLGPSPSYGDHNVNRLPPLPPTPASSISNDRHHGAYSQSHVEHHAALSHTRPVYASPYDQPRHYSHESLSARPPPSPSSAEQVYKPISHQGGYGDPYPNPIDSANHQHGRDQYSENLPPPHGLPMPHYQQATRPAAYSMPQQQGPEQAYDSYAGPFVQTNGAARKKAVRASQACESCRQKKCKCDEEKPICGTCAQNQTQCSYRDVPPPKQERTMNQLMELIESMCNRFASLEDSVNQRLSEETLHKTVAHALQSIAPTLDLSHGSDYLTNTTPHTHTAYPELSQRQGYATKREFLEQIDQSPSSRTESQPGHHRSSQQRDSTQNVWQDSMSKQTSCKEAGIDKELVGKDFLAGQLSIPSEHKTGAHKLLIHWQAIKPFYRTLVDPYYVTREEKTRGVLRIWGRGEGHDRSTRLPNRGASALSPSVRSDHESVSSSTSTDGSWGKGFDAGTGPQIRRGLEDCIGGLGPDDSLVLDGASVCKLRDNYFQNIHVMHPILDKQDMYRLIDDFIATYGGNPRSELSNSGSPGSTTFLKGPKRKRSGDLAADMDRTSNSSQAGRNVVEHSPENALILLVLALGKICEHRQNLPAAVSDMGPPEAAHSPRYGESPSHAFRSPHVTSTPSSAAATKLDGGNVSPRKMSRTSSEAGNPGPRRALRNIDRIPGLAYFAYATEILGEINGTMSLVYVQSCILAGLYKGQLARVMESWKWIYEACMNWLLLVKGEVNLETTHIETALGHKTREEADSLRMTYWTCLQLESDILAEFDFLPHSAISQFEDQMDHPQGPALRSQDPEDTLIMLYYCAQIALRKLLNRAHSALYNSQKGKMPNPGWSITNSDDLAIALQEWKEHLPSPLQWSEDDDPASHINAARLRGKYYGARYIIHRPFLHHALQKELGIDTPFDRELGLPENRRIVDMSQKSVRAAIKSTIAFDGLYGRPIITNPFGTAQAQFGNMLVLAATKASQTHGWLVSQDDLTPLFERTFRFLGRLTPHSKTMRINVRILENAKAELDRLKDDHDKKQIHQHDTFSAANSFGSNRS